MGEGTKMNNIEVRIAFLVRYAILSCDVATVMRLIIEFAIRSMLGTNVITSLRCACFSLHPLSSIYTYLI